MSRLPQSETPTLAGTVVLVEDDADIGRLVEHHLQEQASSPVPIGLDASRN